MMLKFRGTGVLARITLLRQFRGFRWWWLVAALGQVAFAAVIFFAFSGLFPKVGAPGGVFGYGLSVFAGIILWAVFQDSFLQGVNLYDEYRGYILRFRISLASYGFATSILRCFTFLIGIVILICGSWFVYGAVNAKVLFLLFLVPIFLALGVGSALVGGALAAVFPQLRHFAPQALLFWFFGTPIVYPRSVMPPWVNRIISLNPMTYVVEVFQWLWFPSIVVGPWHWVITMVWSGGVLILGLVMTRMLSARILDSL